MNLEINFTVFWAVFSLRVGAEMWIWHLEFFSICCLPPIFFCKATCFHSWMPDGVARSLFFPPFLQNTESCAMWKVWPTRDRAGGTRGPHKGLNLPKRFTNLSVLDSSGPQNEKRLSYRKQKSCLGSKLNFVFYTCLPHYNLSGRQKRQASLCSDFTEMLE